MPLEYYVYAYLREDLSPYYIGKGKGDRAYRKDRVGTKPPKDKIRIVICESNLTELGAFALERRSIRWYGRKDNGTGILRNRTDGGEGCSGMRHSDTSKLKISKSRQGKPSPVRGRKHTEEAKRKISESQTGEKNHYFGKSLSEEHRKKMSEARMGKKLSAETIKKRTEAWKRNRELKLKRLSISEQNKEMQLCP